jgi:heme/copper-type cytochrome/quinol oxidase subunit 3
MSERSTVPDLSSLPTSGFNTHALWSWAGGMFMLMESAGFALGGAAYVYVMNSAERWPPEGPPPDLLWGSAQTALLLVSLGPAWRLSRASRCRDRNRTRTWAVAVAVLNGLAILIRALELGRLEVRWDSEAYGSVTWALMMLHTLHLITDFVDTAILTVFLFTHPVDTERFSDVQDDTIYWMFVVATWIPLYLLIYWAPRWGP